jgi:hypothetical protein
VSGVGVFPLPHSPFSQKGKISDSMDVGGMGRLNIYIYFMTLYKKGELGIRN